MFRSKLLDNALWIKAASDDLPDPLAPDIVIIFMINPYEISILLTRFLKFTYKRINIKINKIVLFFVYDYEC